MLSQRGSQTFRAPCRIGTSSGWRPGVDALAHNARFWGRSWMWRARAAGRSFVPPIRLRTEVADGRTLSDTASVAGDFADPVEWGLANAAGAGIGRVAAMHADRRFRKSGRVRCGLRVIDGTQPGLPGRWRVGVASLSARRLDFRRRWWRVLGECPPIEVVAVHGPPRAPSGEEILKLPGSVVQIQTPTATLEWALHDRYQSAAVARLKVARWVPAEETAE